VLQVIVGKNGPVKDIRALSGHPLLAEAAERAVWQWRFRPYRILGEAVETDAQVTVNFELTPRKKTAPGAPKTAQKPSHLC
jgi:outer membrane biosynthesis protein TonB